MSQAEALYHLQEIELSVIRRQKRLAEITQILGDDKVVAAAQADVAAVQAALAPLRTRARNLELEIQSNVQKTRATDDQLYSGKVKNTKELQDMQQEIVSLKKRHGELEELLLDVMLSVDDRETALTDAEAALARVVETRQGSQRDLLDEQAALQREVTTLKAQRETALKDVAPDSLAKYNALRPKKNNQPISVLYGESCSVCGVEQTMAIVRQAQLAQSLVTCHSCGRILVSKAR